AVSPAPGLGVQRRPARLRSGARRRAVVERVRVVDLTPELAARFAALALGHVTREYPNKLDHVLSGPDDLRGPRALHPIFFGSFDWHSCVHGYWMLCTLLRTFPALPHAARIRALLDDQLTAENVAAGSRARDTPGARTWRA